MSLQTKSDPIDDLLRPTDQTRQIRGEANLWQLLGTLYRWRRFIVGVTSLMAVLAVVLSLLAPNWYKASARLLLPEGGSGGLSTALLGDLSSAAQSLLGSGGDYVRYFAILSSRTVYESVVDSFNLVQVYKLEDSDTPHEDAIKFLSENTEFLIDDEYEFLAVEVLDRDPQQAADMANFFVRALNRVNSRLLSQTAANFRRYAEQRYLESQATRDSLLNHLKTFQKQYGIFDLEAQTTAYFNQLADLRASTIEVEIQYEAFREHLGPDNAQVQNLAEIVRAANRKYQQALAGQEQVMPVAQDTVPEMFRQYLDLTLERTIQERILELAAPMLEQARFDEQRRIEAVQVVDMAIPPVIKAKPKRSIIVIAATLSAFILAVIFALLYEWWQHNHAYFAHRLQEAAEAQPPRDLS